MARKIILDNGVRVVLERMSALKSVALGLWINVGTRDEGVTQSGLSHFLEHMMFKGTRRRSATQIAREIDSLGGEMNAFTTHESTTFYIKVLDQQIGQAVDLLADLFYHSRFDSREIEREKLVVLEEIRTVQDDPEDFVQELHAKKVLKGHPLGRSILGNRGTMEHLQRRDIVRYMEEQYHPEKVVIAVAGNFHSHDLLQMLDKSFGEWEARKPKVNGTRLRKPPEIHGGTFIHTKKLEQAHLCIGFKGISIGHPDRYAAYILNALLGGGVSSRLFQEIREKRGLAYTIYTQLASFADIGTLTVYAATGIKEPPAVVDVVCREIRKLRKREVTREELERTKNQLKGTLMLSLEGTYGRMNKLAKDEIWLGRSISLQEIVSAIDQVLPEDIQRLSQNLLDFDTMAITALGRISKANLPKKA